jgi:broad specificity phosphatase PhoE
MQRCSSVASIPQFDQMVLLVRHAERSEISDIRTHATAMLTEQGKADSKVLGRVLGNRFQHVVIWHSPIPRCRDTAGYMVHGMKETTCKARIVGPLSWLSGDFVKADPGWINHEIVKSTENFFRQWSDGCYSEDQITPMKEAAAVELEKIITQIKNGNSSVIIDVTHDWNILLLREIYLGLHFEEVGLPDYLDSVAILKQGRRLALWSLGCLCIAKT